MYDRRYGPRAETQRAPQDVCRGGRISIELGATRRSNSKRIDVLFDVYKENSIKNAERGKRGDEFGNEFRNIQSEHKLQQWRKFLLNPRRPSQSLW